MIITKDICAHYDDGRCDPENGMFSKKVGECLFYTRNWSSVINPERCRDCPTRENSNHG